MKKVAVLGAGFAGLSSGWLLKQKGIDFTVLERQSYAGGLARSFEWNGFQCDFAAHRLFTRDEDILAKLLQLVPMGRHIRRSQIYLRGHWLNDPLDVWQLASKYSPTDTLQLLWTYLFRPRSEDEDSFEEYVLHRYGKGLYSLFFQPYTEKLFGIPGNEISILWARQKVRLSSPLDRFRENTKTKFQYFYYPVRGGYGSISNRLYNDIEQNVLLNTTVLGLETEGGQVKSVKYQHEGKVYEEQFDAVISTVPMTITGRLLGHNFSLSFRKVDAVYLHINRPLLTDNHWIYFIDKDISINRMVEFKNMSPVDTPENTTVVCAEVTQDHDDVIEKVSSDLIRVGLLKREEILDSKVVREDFSYPVYNEAYSRLLENAQDLLGQYSNLFTVGRNAEFRHREIDDNFATAMETVEEIEARFRPEARVKAMPKEKPETRPSPRVTAVILAMNNYADTHECLESLQESTYRNFDAILVDNGSEDGTPEKARQDFPDVRVIENKKNLGVPAGYNVGFSEALRSGAEYILMLNNDVVMPPDFLEKLVASAEADEQTGIVMPKVLYYGSEDEVWSSGGRYRAFPPAILMTDNRKGIADSTRYIEYAPGCALLIHRKAFELAGLFDPGYLFLYDDWDFSERVRAHGIKILYTPDTIIWHKVSRTTKGPKSPLFWKTMAASSVRYYRRHGRIKWLSLPIHIGYIVLREFIFKGNWKHLRHFVDGAMDGLRRPLNDYPVWDAAE